MHRMMYVWHLAVGWLCQPKLSDEAAGKFVSEFSTNFTLWSVLTTLDASAEGVEFFDTPPAGITQRLYRVQWQP